MMVVAVVMPTVTVVAMPTAMVVAVPVVIVAVPVVMVVAESVMVVTLPMVVAAALVVVIVVVAVAVTMVVVMKLAVVEVMLMVVVVVATVMGGSCGSGDGGGDAGGRGSCGSSDGGGGAGGGGDGGCEDGDNNSGGDDSGGDNGGGCGATLSLSPLPTATHTSGDFSDRFPATPHPTPWRQNEPPPIAMSVSCSNCLPDSFLLCGEDSSGILSGDLPECSSDLDSSPPSEAESIAGFIEDERNFVPDSTTSTGSSLALSTPPLEKNPLHGFSRYLRLRFD
ncbi:hypothetical protein E2542_SST06096 [Spatholobus suberectus]|nr:hypothetical protein E2542_SST06096 [Spatholobus suberectus]